jgi:hypothetical protein
MLKQWRVYGTASTELRASLSLHGRAIKSRRWPCRILALAQGGTQRTTYRGDHDVQEPVILAFLAASCVLQGHVMSSVAWQHWFKYAACTTASRDHVRDHGTLGSMLDMFMTIKGN